jgi:predicted DNA-binding transcriptional regulator AlpA
MLDAPPLRTTPLRAPAIELDEPSFSAAKDDREVHLRDTFELLSSDDLALLIGVDERTLAVWRSQKRGPDYVRLGRAIFYRRADVRSWVELNVTPTDRCGG